MPLKNQHFYKLLRIHRWLGLFISVHIMVLALSGVILVFREELGGGAPEPASASRRTVPLQSLVDKALNDFPTDRPLSLAVDEGDPQRIHLRFGKDGSRNFRGARRLLFDRSSGAALEDGEPETGAMRTLLILHRELFLGTWGKLYVGVIGIIYAFILISGFLMYGPMMRRLRFATLRKALKPRVWWSDLHKYFGAMTFAWSLMIALTGAMLAWNGPLLKLYQGSLLKSLPESEPGAAEGKSLVPLDRALEAALAARPHGRFSFVAFPDTEFSTKRHYIFVLEGPTPLTQKLSELVLVDAYDGTPGRVLDLPWYLKGLLLSEPLHFGAYGGPLMKACWALFGLFSLVLPLSGLWIFLQRFRRESAEKRERDRTPPARKQPERTRPQGPYALPLLIAFLSWSGLLAALLVEGHGDLAASLCLASVFFISLWHYWRHRRALPSD